MLWWRQNDQENERLLWMFDFRFQISDNEGLGLFVSDLDLEVLICWLIRVLITVDLGVLICWLIMEYGGCWRMLLKKKVDNNARNAQFGVGT